MSYIIDKSIIFEPGKLYKVIAPVLHDHDTIPRHTTFLETNHVVKDDILLYIKSINISNRAYKTNLQFIYKGKLFLFRKDFKSGMDPYKTLLVKLTD